MRERAGWRWNGRVEPDVRCDVMVWRDGQAWAVEERHGGDDGWSKIITAVNEDDAFVIAGQLGAPGVQWRDVSEIPSQI